MCMSVVCIRIQHNREWITVIHSCLIVYCTNCSHAFNAFVNVALLCGPHDLHPAAQPIALCVKQSICGPFYIYTSNSTKWSVCGIQII